jgi:hypothetical protein
MAREIDISDAVAITATVGRRIGDRVTLRIPTAIHPCSIRDEKAKAPDNAV